MSLESEEAKTLEIARRWCAHQGDGWSVIDTAGRGGTAPVFAVQSPDGDKALKIYDSNFSDGKRGEESERRLGPQLRLGVHDCPYLVKFYDGGRFEDRLFLLMNRAPGKELEKRLGDVPRNKIRGIVDQVTKACIYLRHHGLCHRDLKSANIFVSDDFERVTVLDLSVARDIEDPVGTGTDHGGQLPVVATSRYSPPEYLFRLIAPSVELWHALDIYQLGGVLHDLIMRQPMFQSEYSLSRENRYRFAWVVATVDPEIEADDVDADLVLLARRALDKKWERRGTLQLEDFLDEAQSHRLHGLEALGLSNTRTPKVEPISSVNLHRHVTEMANTLEAGVRSRLRQMGVTTTHSNKPGANDSAKTIIFEWNSSKLKAATDAQDVQLLVELHSSIRLDSVVYDVELKLEATINGRRRIANMNLPTIEAGSNASETLTVSISEALATLAATLMRTKTN